MKSYKDAKVAIIHDQLTQYGGAERTLEALLDIFPEADIFTGFCDPVNISQRILDRKIVSGPKLLKYLGFIMPFVFEWFDLRKYDIVISEGTAWPKGVITSPGQLHINYTYTPPRFLYGYNTEGQKREIWYLKPFLKVIDHFLRIWDYSAAQRPDYMLSISQEVAKRVKKFYGRDSQVIYPPVELASESSSQNDGLEPPDKYYLCISRLAAYKNVDLLIRAFNKTGFKLKIAGTGKEERRLRSMAGEKVEMLGFVNNEQKGRLLAGCKGFVFPADYEDFGIVVVEALSYGKPVLCHRSGGPLEIISEGETGMLFDGLDTDKLAQKITEFDKNIDDGKYNTEKAIVSSRKFGVERFKKEFENFVKQKWEEMRNG
jgi:glycosyltransferase involved in cell wall biosynthesis